MQCRASFRAGRQSRDGIRIALIPAMKSPANTCRNRARRTWVRPSRQQSSCRAVLNRFVLPLPSRAIFIVLRGVSPAKTLRARDSLRSSVPMPHSQKKACLRNCAAPVASPSRQLNRARSMSASGMSRDSESTTRAQTASREAWSAPASAASIAFSQRVPRSSRVLGRAQRLEEVDRSSEWRGKPTRRSSRVCESPERRDSRMTSRIMRAHPGFDRPHEVAHIPDRGHFIHFELDSKCLLSRNHQF